MKKILLCCLLLLSVCYVLPAQTASGQGNSPLNRPGVDTIARRTAEEMKRSLNLTAEQANQLFIIEKAFLTARYNLPQNITAQLRKQEFDKLEKKKMDDIKKVLTGQQYQQFIRLLDERKRMIEEKRRQISANGNTNG